MLELSSATYIYISRLSIIYQHNFKPDNIIPAMQGKMTTQLMQACDNLSEEQHPVSFWSKGPEKSLLKDINEKTESK